MCAILTTHSWQISETYETTEQKKICWQNLHERLRRIWFGWVFCSLYFFILCQSQPTVEYLRCEKVTLMPVLRLIFLGWVGLGLGIFRRFHHPNPNPCGLLWRSNPRIMPWRCYSACGDPSNDVAMTALWVCRQRPWRCFICVKHCFWNWRRVCSCVRVL